MNEFEIWAKDRDNRYCLTIWCIDPKTGERVIIDSTKTETKSHIKNILEYGHMPEYQVWNAVREFWQTGQPVTFSRESPSIGYRMMIGIRGFLGNITSLYYTFSSDFEELP